jgi:histidinol dehydrogenase
MNVVAASETVELGALIGSGWGAPEAVVDEVARILADVRDRGDAAIEDCARRYDDDRFDLAHLRQPIPMTETARTMLPREITGALELARERIARFHERQRQPELAFVEEDGARYGVQRRPLRSVAVYAGRLGSATAALMGAVPAKIAGVPRIVVLSPPRAEGMRPALLFACALCGVDELYAVGGAQAVGAAAFGTASIAPVDKIVGRGGLWTTEAKRQVYGHCGVDALAGPAEVLVVADEGASSEYIVGELLAQAELPGVTRLGVLSESRPLLEAVAQLIDTLDLRTLERDEFVELVNRIAPAYLSLQVRDASPYIDRIHAAGAAFVGDMTPLSSGAYLAGCNSVVPTSGTARFASSLSLRDFTREFVVVENSMERMTNDAPALAALSDFDGLPHHAQTVRMRCER